MDDEEAFQILKDHKAKQKAAKYCQSATKGTKLTDEERREKIRQGLLRKKECEAKALAVVEALIEPNIDKEWLRKAVNLINPSHFEDVTEERLCVKLCGFPLCDSPIQSMPKQQFKISTSQNKVFDITERKKFCSDLCFKKACHFKAQIPTVPLWMREETDQVVIRYLEEESNAKAPLISGAGEEVALITKVTPGSVEASTQDPEDAMMSSMSAMSLDTDVMKKSSQCQMKVKGKDKVKVKKAKKESVAEKMSRILHEWFTLDSAKELLGTEALQERFLELGLDISLLAEAPEVADDLHEAVNEESVKVAAFLRGKTFDSKFNKEIQERDTADEDPVLPSLDRYAQKTLRRRIVLDQLNRVFPDILQLCDGLKSSIINEQLKKLLGTFEFSSENIVLKTNEWTFLSVALLLMLTKMNPLVLEKLESESTKKSLNLLLLSFNSSLESLKVMISQLSSNLHDLAHRKERHK